MNLDVTFFLFAIPAVFFAGISKAGFGSGAAFASASILALIVTPGQALGIMLPLLILIDVASLRPYWGKWDWPVARRLLIGAIPGVIIATWIYQIANADVFRFLIGMMSLLFVSYQIARSMDWFAPASRPIGPIVGLFIGAVSGFTSFVSHAGGPPVAIYLLSQKFSKTSFQATTVIIFWAINIMKFIPYALLGIFTWQTLTVDLLLAPIALVGTWLGVRAHQFVSERVFFALTYILLTLTGSKLIWDALAGS